MEDTETNYEVKEMIAELNYEGTTFLVSNKGQIYSPDGKEYHQHTLTNKQTGYENKYVYVSYYDEKLKRSRRVQVSRLVCMAFHPIENPERYQVDHIDSNPQNNISSNLRFVSRKFNNSRKHTRMLKSQNHRKTSRKD